ncbi:MAG: type II toxin-antitoxin system VapC family toxin [Thermomicrobiales bacterium]
MIDSDVLVSYLEGDGSTVSLVNDLIPAGIAISIVTYMETYQGVLRSVDPASSERRHALVINSLAILPFSESTARTRARLRHQPTIEGKKIRERALDLMIAATAIEHGLVLATRNLADSRDIPDLQVS